MKLLIFNAIHLLTGIITLESSPCYHSPYCGQVNTDLFRAGICTQYFWTISWEKKHVDILILYNGWDGLGIRSPTLIQGKGTFAFTVVDDLVEWCCIWIPNNIFVSGSTHPLVYPQHWAQSANQLSPLADSTIIINTTTGYQMYWDHCKHCQMVKRNTSMNTPIFWNFTRSPQLSKFSSIISYNICISLSWTWHLHFMSMLIAHRNFNLWGMCGQDYSYHSYAVFKLLLATTECRPFITK